MKINRLLEIVIILMNRGTVTARELSQRFGVSMRTIYRDVDDLSSSGVPVYSSKGVGGGISLLENYSIGKALLSEKETESILFALKTLQATKYPEIDSIFEKLGTIFKNGAADWIHIDFSPWGSDPNQYDKMTLIKNAILNSKIIEFDYISANNTRTHRRFEPLRLIFKGQAWYLWGWCEARLDYRTFRISRIRELKTLDENFIRHRERFPSAKTNEGEGASKPEYNPLVSLSLKFSEEALSRLYDDYDDDLIINNNDGTYTLNISFPLDEWVYGYILSFGNFVEVLSPPEVKSVIINKMNMALRKYEATGK